MCGRGHSLTWTRALRRSPLWWGETRSAPAANTCPADPTADVAAFWVQSQSLRLCTVHGGVIQRLNRRQPLSHRAWETGSQSKEGPNKLMILEHQRLVPTQSTVVVLIELRVKGRPGRSLKAEYIFYFVLFLCGLWMLQCFIHTYILCVSYT